MLHAEKGRQILLQNDVLFWLMLTSLLIIIILDGSYCVFPFPQGGACNWRSGMIVPDMHEI